MHKFTWLFLATYADPKALPTVMRTQADTEADARQMLAGDYSLTFAAKINTACPVRAGFCDDQTETSWHIIGHHLPTESIKAWGDSLFGGAAHA
ncbi:host cell division inhibitor Icd-like protein [Salmonella enterica]|nr:host cell division inhibitor Icd-like protein [Salmonella enterica]HCM1893423.1 host cell division inhibitor Icd-like protein [Salmonella enterica subsp. diarizonae serovar 57:c:e,n,x,z15]EGQ5164895.1 host cell division inhibitor Icd-like protein [Salmonella enterica]EKA4657691.1 host cell division inhibitor Icd-like protein [Salmonella enterica]EKF8523541.1 host cell division inhibitor Icd-like protein [Salmonella enterica]